jgi:hypothetical protein
LGPFSFILLASIIASFATSFILHRLPIAFHFHELFVTTSATPHAAAASSSARASSAVRAFPVPSSTVLFPSPLCELTLPFFSSYLLRPSFFSL